MAVWIACRYAEEVTLNEIYSEKMVQHTRGFGLLENFLSKKRAEISNKLIPKRHREGKILDIGCGSYPYFLLHTRFKEKIGIDSAAKKVDNIKIIGQNIDNGFKIPFHEKHFDVVTMLAVFEHIEPDIIVNVLKEIKRILKENGRFILTTPCPWTDLLLRVMARLGLISKEEIEEHKGSYNHKKIRKYLILAGFEKDKIRLGYFELFLNNWAYADK
ncbi:MAG: class I SAM-dependent methyltransferase [Candidatus Woesearchaeota archaeon]